MIRIKNKDGKLVLEEIDLEKENIELIMKAINRIEDYLELDKTKFYEGDENDK